MEIRRYQSIYKKAVLDLTKKTVGIPGMTETTLNLKNKICFLGFENNKFKAFILGAPIPNEDDGVFVTHWASKKAGLGIELLQYGKEYIKKQGYKYVEYLRGKDRQYVREEL